MEESNQIGVLRPVNQCGYIRAIEESIVTKMTGSTRINRRVRAGKSRRVRAGKRTIQCYKNCVIRTKRPGKNSNTLVITASRMVVIMMTKMSWEAYVGKTESKSVERKKERKRKPHPSKERTKKKKKEKKKDSRGGEKISTQQKPDCWTR